MTFKKFIAYVAQQEKRKNTRIIKSIDIDVDGDCTMGVWRKSAMKDILKKGRWITNS